MTERLSALLHQEAASLEVPAADARGVITRGRVLRRRRRLTMAATGLVIATGIGAAAATGWWGGDAEQPKGVDPATSETSLGAAFSIGTTVYLDGGRKHVSIDDKAIKSSYYTSAGLLVRHGENNFSDGGGPQRFSLVTDDGTVQRVSVVTEETVPGVDPTQPYLAYAAAESGEVEVVVHDISTDEEVARVRMPGDFEWGGWSAPPVALSGDTVYVGTADVMRTVNWRTGEIGVTDTLAPGYPDVQGGRSVQQSEDEAKVVDAATGDTLLTVPVPRFGYVALSPDGRFAILDAEDGESFAVYDVGSGTHIEFEGASYEYGWTLDGHLYRISDQHVVTCSATDGTCETGTEKIPTEGGGVAPKDVRFAGQIFES